MEGMEISQCSLRQAKNNEQKFEMIEKLREPSKSGPDKSYIRAQLAGLSDKSDGMRREMHQLHEDIHDMVQEVFIELNTNRAGHRSYELSESLVWQHATKRLIGRLDVLASSQNNMVGRSKKIYTKLESSITMSNLGWL